MQSHCGRMPARLEISAYFVTSAAMKRSNASGSMPDTRSVRAANICRIAVHRPQGGDMALVLVVEDNLVKGAAGQAIQNMNLMFGLPETTGLAAPPVLP